MTAGTRNSNVAVSQVWIDPVTGAVVGAVSRQGDIQAATLQLTNPAAGGGLPSAGQGAVFDAQGNLAAGPASDPLQVGYVSTFAGPEAVANTVLNVNSAYYQRLLAGGYQVSNLVVQVSTSTGNICVGTYANAGTGVSAAPTGGQTSTSGSIATPAIGIATIALGGPVTPALGDWGALSCSAAAGVNITLGSGLVTGRATEQSSAFPLPATPSGLSATAGAARWILMRGA